MEEDLLKEVSLDPPNEEKPQDPVDNEDSNVVFIDINYSEIIVLSFSEESIT